MSAQNYKERNLLIKKEYHAACRHFEIRTIKKLNNLILKKEIRKMSANYSKHLGPTSKTSPLAKSTEIQKLKEELRVSKLLHEQIKNEIKKRGKNENKINTQ